MAYRFAGVYGPEPVLSDNTVNPALLPSTPVAVYLRGTTTLAALYTSKAKASAAPNPVTTNVLGEVTFHVDPGDYDLLINGATKPVTVNTDPAEAAQLGADGKLLASQSGTDVAKVAATNIFTKSNTFDPDNTQTPITLQFDPGWTVGDGGPDPIFRVINTQFAVGSPYRLGFYLASEGHLATGLSITCSNKRVNATGTIQATSAVADGSEPWMVAASPDINGPAFAGEAHGNMAAGFENQAAFAAYDLDDVSGGTTAYSAGYGKKKWMVSGKGSQYWGSNLGITPLTTHDLGLIKGGPGIIRWRASSLNSTEVQIDAAAGRAALLAFQNAGATKWQVGNHDDNIFRLRDVVNSRYVLQVVAGPSATASQIYVGAIFRHADAALEQTTVGAAGAASALPAAPSRYGKLVGADGVTYVFPMYAAA